MTAFRPEGPALSVVIGGRRFALPAGAVRRVGSAGPLTALPFVPGWIEGLTAVEGRPMLQIDPARAPGGGGEGGRRGDGDRLVVIDAPGGAAALRVERVEPSAGPAPPLALEALVRDLAAGGRSGDALALFGVDRPGGDAPAIILVVASGAMRIGIPLDEGVSVGEVAASLSIGSGDGQLTATIGDRLLPARRLSEQGGAGRAVIGPTADGWMALLVERLIGLERVAVDRLVPLPGAPPGRNLCFPVAGGDPVLLRDFEGLAGGRGAVGAAYRHLLERVQQCVQQRRDRAPPPSWRKGAAGSGGLVLTIGDARWLLPLALVERMLGVDERLVDGQRAPGRGSVSLIDAGRCFLSRGGLSCGTEAVLLRLPGGARIALRADRIALEDASAAGPWLPPPPLPPGPASLVDAVRAEPDSGGWCLRLAAALDPASLPSFVRRAVAAARLGRLAPFDPLQTNLLGTPS